MIRTTKHTTKFSNTGKKTKYNEFIDEYRRVAALYMTFLWNNPITYEKYSFDIQNKNVNIPSMMSNPFIEEMMGGIETTLSARARKSCLTQTLGVIKSVTRKLQKQQAIYVKYNNIHAKKKIDEFILAEPNTQNLNPELDSNCSEFIERTEGEFNAFVHLKSLGKYFGEISIPVKFHRRSKKYLNWIRKSGILLSNKSLDIRWETETPTLRDGGSTIGADQGLKSVITLSNGWSPPTHNPHGRSLDGITLDLSRSKKGSRRFVRKQKERENFINWSINQLNLDGIGQINFEDIVNINYKKKSSRFMSHWTNTLIRDKLLSYCEEHGVRVVSQSAAYRSQRCSGCGLVLKSNRRGKQYCCKRCGLEIDADLNAALNHECELPILTFDMGRVLNSRKGFYWISEGIYLLTGEEFTVPLAKNEH